ncbi:MAG: hypothetical protein HY288_03185 [Planctomycetia bacterium]|nr:hypothetical protein [Planctomycetia bacterium]
MTRTQILAVSFIFGALVVPTLAADEVKTYEKDGVKYQEVRRVVQRPITETRYEPRQVTQYHERYTTDMQEMQRTYQTPVTQQQWVPGYQRTWNLFAPPVLSYRLMPVTRWETRTETVRVPVTKREVIPEQVTQQVPVTTQRIVQDEHVSTYALGTVPSGGTSSVANRDDVGGVNKLDDPPRNDSLDQISRRR